MCDCAVALGPAAAGTTLFAKNSDRPPGEAQFIEWRPPRRDSGAVRTTYIDVAPAADDTIGALVSRPWWLWGVEHGVNEAGVAIGNETIYTTLDPRPFPPALTGMDLVRLGLERGATVAGAVEVIVDLLDRYGQGGSGHHGVDRPYWSSFLVADPREAFVVETSGREYEVEEVAPVRAISNRTTISSFDAAHRHPNQPVESLVDPRWHATQAVLARRPVTVEALIQHSRAHVGGDDGWTVCMHVEDVEATTAAVVASLPDGGRPLARMLLGSPCTSVFVPLYVGRPLGQAVAWERFAALRPEHRPVLDELESSLAADATDDDEWAPTAWSRVDATLRSLGA